MLKINASRAGEPASMRFALLTNARLCIGEMPSQLSTGGPKMSAPQPMPIPVNSAPGTIDLGSGGAIFWPRAEIDS